MKRSYINVSKTKKSNTKLQRHKMVGLLFLCALVSLCLLSHSEASAQVVANVSLNRKTVYVQQPFHVTITVYTQTWFTAPLEFGNLQIPNAFIVPFDKTQPGMFTIGGKQYPGIQFYYIVFPYKAGAFTVPSLEITAQSPPVGSSTSRKITLHTRQQTFTVKDVPPELKKKGTWFVAKNVMVHETWNPSLKNLKTGDIIKRSITIDAQGTLPQFIPNLNNQENVNWASTYTQDPILTDTRGNGDANGRSTQTITYLLEKEGDFTIPGISLSYWNPYAAKMETKTTKDIRIHVMENPNLGILKTLKDSLSTTIKVPESKSKKTPFLIFGMKWYTFAGWTLLTCFCLFILIKIGRYLFNFIRKKRKHYLQSESYLFKKFQHANYNHSSFINALYRWWDHFPDKFSASVGKTLSYEKESESSVIFKNYFEQIMTHATINTQNQKIIKTDLKTFRKKKLEVLKMQKQNLYFMGKKKH